MHVKELKSNYIICDNGEQRVVVYGADDVSFDDVMEVKGSYERIDTVHNIQSFSFSNWLARRDIYYQINAKEVKLLKEGTSLRHRLYTKINNQKDIKQKTWIRAMLFGIHEDDVSFFVTSSGMHISFVFMMIEKILLRYVTKGQARFLTILGIGMCGYVSVFSASLLRVLCFRIIAYVCDGWTQDDALGASMVLVLVLFPYMVYELAFLLPVGFRLIHLFSTQRKKRWVTSFVVLIPIQFVFFHTCNPIQILWFKYIRIIYALLYVSCWVLVVSPISFLFHLSMMLYRSMVNIEQIGISLYFTPTFWWILLWVYYVIQYMTYQNHALRWLCLLLVYAPFSSYLNPFGEISVLDVGQGNCTFIVLPFHQGTMLIDVMGSLYKNIPEDIIVPALKSRGIHSLDKVIITHQDYDHSGGLDALKKVIPIKEIIEHKQERTMLGPLTIALPLSDYEGIDENENSIITYLEVFGVNVLFMGDAGYVSEQAFLSQYPKLKVDVLQVGHHGSKTSSSLAFLHSIQPRLALISAGRNNRYGHPHQETLDRIHQENIYPLMTSRSGEISIKFSKYFTFYRTADNEFGIIETR